MEIDYRRAVDDAIEVTAVELAPWVQSRLGRWPSDKFGNVAPEDPSYLISVILDHWRSHFVGALGREGMTVVQEFRHTRNRCAHYKPFEPLEAFRAIDTCRLLLRAIGSDRESGLADAALLLINDDRTRPAESPVRNAPSVRTLRPSGLHRKASSPDFRMDQWERRFDPHVAPINQLVDHLIAQHGDSWMPYVAPYHGGTKATIVLLFQDPGRMTDASQGGSGFIGCENDDPSAELLAECLDQSRVDQLDVMPWNAYPWFLPAQGGVTAALRNLGLAPLREVLSLVPQVHTVVSCGAVAHDTWRRFSLKYPADAARLRHLETFHTSGRGITNGGQQTKVAGVAHVIDTLRTAAATSAALGHRPAAVPHTP